MEPLYTFAGNGSGGSVSLKIFPTFFEYEHNNYLVAVPLSKLENVSHSKSKDKVYSSVSLGNIDFGCDNKEEVYAALKQVLSGLR
jgi:hypothetical protein